MTSCEGLEIFVKVVDCGSFSDAAKKLKISKSHVSKQVAGLENRLGARLLNRTTRTIKLTEVGSNYYDRCAKILADIDEAELAVSSLQTTPKGSLRITAPVSFGEKYLGKAVAEFMSQFKGLDVELNFTNEYIDIIDEEYDLAIRFGPLQDSTFIARKIASRKLFMCASPAYIAEHGEPVKLEDLKDHNCLQGCSTTWQLMVGKDITSYKISGNWKSNNGDALLVAAEAGLGIIQLPHYYVKDKLASGALVEVLPEYNGLESAAWAIYPNKNLSAKVRVFVDFLVDYFSTVNIQ